MSAVIITQWMGTWTKYKLSTYSMPSPGGWGRDGAGREMTLCFLPRWLELSQKIKPWL